MQQQDEWEQQARQDKMDAQAEEHRLWRISRNLPPLPKVILPPEVKPEPKG